MRVRSCVVASTVILTCLVGSVGCESDAPSSTSVGDDAGGVASDSGPSAGDDGGASIPDADSGGATSDASPDGSSPPPPSCPPSWTVTPQCGGPSSGTAPDFGPNVLVFDPSMPRASIQSQLDQVYAQQDAAQFGTGR